MEWSHFPTRSVMRRGRRGDQETLTNSVGVLDVDREESWFKTQISSSVLDSLES